MYFNVYGHVDLHRAVCAIGLKAFFLFISFYFSLPSFCLMLWVLPFKFYFHPFFHFFPTVTCNIREL